MSIVDDLIENLIERNVIQLNGTLTVSLQRRRSRRQPPEHDD
jgi:hypothetical protein